MELASESLHVLHAPLDFTGELQGGGELSLLGNERLPLLTPRTGDLLIEVVELRLERSDALTNIRRGLIEPSGKPFSLRRRRRRSRRCRLLADCRDCASNNAAHAFPKEKASRTAVNDCWCNLSRDAVSPAAICSCSIAAR